MDFHKKEMRLFFLLLIFLLLLVVTVFVLLFFAFPSRSVLSTQHNPSDAFEWDASFEPVDEHRYINAFVTNNSDSECTATLFFSVHHEFSGRTWDTVDDYSLGSIPSGQTQYFSEIVTGYADFRAYSFSMKIQPNDGEAIWFPLGQEPLTADSSCQNKMTFDEWAESYSLAHSDKMTFEEWCAANGYSSVP